jgi:hypothetical protein
MNSWSTDNISNLKKCMEIDPENGKRDLSIKSKFIIEKCCTTIGIPNITEENFELVYDRIFDIEQLLGQAVRWENREDGYKPIYYPIELDDVKNMIGLTTSGPEFTLVEWKTKIKETKDKIDARTKELEEQYKDSENKIPNYVDMRNASVVTPGVDMPEADGTIDLAKLLPFNEKEVKDA